MIGIVTISFNQAEFLKEAIDSVLDVSQGTKVKYVVVDAGSTDTTPKILSEQATGIDVLIQEPDKGPADGLNKGFAHCHDCDILGYINADDRLRPGALKWVREFFDTHPSVDVLLGAISIIDKDGKVSRRARVSDDFNAQRYAVGACNVFQQGTFFRKSAFDGTRGFNIQNRTCWDGELAVDLALSGASFFRVRKILGDFRIYPSSITGSNRFASQYALDKQRIASKIYASGIEQPSTLLDLLEVGASTQSDPPDGIPPCPLAATSAALKRNAFLAIVGFQNRAVPSFGGVVRESLLGTVAHLSNYWSKKYETDVRYHHTDPAHGGPVECAIQLNKNITARGHSYDVVTLDRPEAEWNKRLPFEPICLGRGSKDPDMVPPALVKFLKQSQSKYDGSIFHGIWTVPNVAMRFAWDGKHPYVVFSHGMLDPYFIRNFPLKHIKKSLFYRAIAAPVLSRAVATLFTCEEELRLANTSYRPLVGNRVVVRYGINPPITAPHTYQGRLSPLKDRLRGKDVVLFLGRIHPKKGCDMLVEAAARIGARFPQAHLLIAGPDETGSVDRLQSLAAARGVSDKLTWVGPVYGDERWFLYNLANAFILPSHMENFGLTVAEALSQARPVLISDKVNIYSSILKAGAGFVAEDTVSGTAQLLEQWCALPAADREAMRNAAKELFETEFQAKHTAEDVLRAFQPNMNSRN